MLKLPEFNESQITSSRGIRGTENLTSSRKYKAMKSSNSRNDLIVKIGKSGGEST